MERENARRYNDLRDYVKKNKLSTEDTDRLAEWVRRQEVVWMQMYRDHILLYDSQFPLSLIHIFCRKMPAFLIYAQKQKKVKNIQ